MDEKIGSRLDCAGTRGKEARGAVTAKPLRWRSAVVVLLLAACGGGITTRTAGGESHFLDVCAESCGGGLECIDSLCTRGCRVERSDCTDLAPNAVCAERSGVSGAVCDLGCSRDRDCALLGDGFACRSGFCRMAVAPPDPPGTGGSGGSGAGPGVETFNDDHCARRGDVQSSCSFEATCAELHCGDGFSQFGADGCTRYCEADADCSPSDRCRHTALAITEDGCPSIGSEVEGCEVRDGECSCSITSDCQFPSVCVDARIYPESQDCVVEGATCSQLLEASDRARWLVKQGGDEASAQAAACLITVDAKRFELACELAPNDPFAPACASPLDFESSCSFAGTCEQLGCGDGLSQFDARGCTRYCDTSADCGEGERCRQTRLVLSEEECPALGSVVEGCSFVNGSCECSSTSDCDHPNICVDVAAHPVSQDCAVEDASCLALEMGEFRLAAFLEAEPSTLEAADARACLDAILAQQQALACSE